MANKVINPIPLNSVEGRDKKNTHLQTKTRIMEILSKYNDPSKVKPLEQVKTKKNTTGEIQQKNKKSKK